MAMISASASAERLLYEHTVSSRRDMDTMVVEWRNTTHYLSRAHSAFAHRSSRTQTCIGIGKLPAEQQGLAHPACTRDAVDSGRSWIPGAMTAARQTIGFARMLPSRRGRGSGLLSSLTLDSSASILPRLQRQESLLRPCLRHSPALRASTAAGSDSVHTSSWERQDRPVVAWTTAVLLLLPLTLALALAGYHLLAAVFKQSLGLIPKLGLVALAVPLVALILTLARSAVDSIWADLGMPIVTARSRRKVTSSTLSDHRFFSRAPWLEGEAKAGGSSSMQGEAGDTSGGSDSGSGRGSVGPIVESSGRVEGLLQEWKQARLVGEEQVRLVQALSKQVEKVGMQMRLTRNMLRAPLKETAQLASSTSERVDTLQEDVASLHRESADVQALLLGLQDQSIRQFELFSTALRQLSATQRAQQELLVRLEDRGRIVENQLQALKVVYGAQAVIKEPIASDLPDKDEDFWAN